MGRVVTSAANIGRIALFRDLTESQRATLAGRCRWNEIVAGHGIIGHDDETREVFLIASGRVRAKRFSAAGREVSYVDIGEGEVTGEFSAVDGKPRASAVVALTDCLVGHMPAEVFLAAVGEHPALARRLIESLVAKARRMSDRIFEFSALAARGRIHAELLRLADEAGVADDRAAIGPAPTHYEIAARISSHREAVTRELNDLEADGLIELGRGRIVVKSVAGLRARLDAALAY